jgi:hypothetical protein
MLAAKARTLFIYGTILAILGIAGVLFSPDAGFGFHPKAKTGLIVGCAGAGLAVLFGAFARQGKPWAATAGAIFAFLFLVITFHRALITWKKVSQGFPEKWYAASLISLMAAASLITLVAVARGLGGARVAPPGPPSVRDKKTTE